MSAPIEVEVVYALANRQVLRRVRLPQGGRVADAIEASGLAAEFPEIGSAPVGIFGVKADRAALLRDRDRVEIYRPLRLDPKDIRRLRAAGRRARGA